MAKNNDKQIYSGEEYTAHINKQKNISTNYDIQHSSRQSVILQKILNIENM